MGQRRTETDAKPVPEGEQVGGAVESADDSHFDDIEDGCGCTEVWEHLSERRAED